MKMVMKLGYNDFVLPDGTDVNALLNVLNPLAKNHVIKDWTPERSIYVRNPVEIEIKVVEDDSIVSERPVRPEPIPPIPADEDIGRVAPIQDPPVLPDPEKSRSFFQNQTDF